MLIFLKMGGSLITEKNKTSTARPDILRQIAGEIIEVKKIIPDLQLVLGHGSGSFGHIPGKEFKTRQGVRSQYEWDGFIKVWREARILNQIVTEAFLDAGLPIMAFPSSSIYRTTAGKITNAFIDNIEAALSHGIIPLVNGDVIFDDVIGGTILSTEEIFFHLADCFKPDRILLAGIEAGVWEDFPVCSRLIPVITPSTFQQLLVKPGGSEQIDVTGGMYTKVILMLELLKSNKELEALIFSGEDKGNITKAFEHNMPGTIIRK